MNIFGIICTILGVLLTVLITLVALYMKYFIGTLRVDQSDPEDNPYLFLELEKDVRAVSSKKYVLMEVKVKDYISRN